METEKLCPVVHILPKLLDGNCVGKLREFPAFWEIIFLDRGGCFEKKKTNGGWTRGALILSSQHFKAFADLGLGLVVFTRWKCHCGEGGVVVGAV